MRRLRARATATTATCRYRLDNIGCASCVATVSNVLEALEGVVESFDVSLEHGGSLSVTARDHDLVRTKLEEAGFPMRPLLGGANENKKLR